MSLKALQVDYVDTYLMHWPCPVDPDDLDKALAEWHFVQTWYVYQLSQCRWLGS